MPYLLALDQGTTSSRAILFDNAGQVVGMAQREFKQHFPRSGWVEHDPADIWESQRDAVLELLKDKQVTAKDIAAIGITNQRETTLLWDRKTGKPLHNAIVWQDRRTADYCQQLKKDGLEEEVTARTGLLLDPYFAGTKLRWLLDYVEGARERAKRGELAFGTVDTWLIWQLTGGKEHLTDPSNASRTLLFNINEDAWDDDLLNKFDIPREVLPEVRPSSGDFGQVSTLDELSGVPIAGVAGDQQAALFGQGCFKPGMAKNTYGTGCFLLMNTGDAVVRSENKLLTTVGWRIEDSLQYALEGSVFVGGALVQFLRDNLGIIKTAAETEELAQSVKDNGGLVFVPAFTGLGAPYWDPHARGALMGLSRGSELGHIVRASLEAIAFQVADLITAMNADADTPLTELRVDGGASANNVLLQFQADILGVPVIRPEVTETTALGAAYLAGLKVGYWKNQEDIAQQWAAERTFEPSMPDDQVKALTDRWHEAVSRSQNWPE